jgi:RNA polymerase sigma-70 factor (ECF subfamily)
MAMIISFSLQPTPDLKIARADWIWNRRAFPAYQGEDMEQAFHSAAPTKDDEQLILKIAQGDRSAFNTLYDRFSTPIYSLALKMLANEAEAQDLLQEVFLSVWNKAGSFRADRGSAFSWVVTQMRNRAIDRIRARRRHGELLEANAPDLEPTGSATPSSAENCEISERAREVRSAMGQLSDDQRQVLRLAFFEGLTQTEIAEKLEEPLGTVKARAHRGMARLRTILKGLHE